MIKIFFIFLLLVAPALAVQNSQLLQTEQHVAELLTEQARLQFEQNNLKQQVSDLTEKIDVLKKQIRIRLVAQSKIQSFRWGELLLNSTYSELNTQLKTLKNLTEHDLKLFQNYRQLLALMKTSAENLKETENLLQKNLENHRRQILELEKLEKIEIDLARQTNSNSLLLRKGQLTRPLNGVVLKNFGQLRDPMGQYFLMTTGELYKATPESPVKAVGPGVVIFRDQLEHWRETLIVQHPGQYYSVYAGLKGLSLQVGDVVSAEQLIGKARDHLFYFELRHGSLAINPKNWFKEKL